MTEVRPVITSLIGHFKLSSTQCPQSPKEEEEMSRVPYARAVGSLMYAIVCTRSDLAYTVSPRSHGHGDITATYIRRAKIPSYIYAKHQYKQKLECESTKGNKYLK